METRYLPVGTPLIEQDAEYLSQLIAAHGIPCCLAQAPDHELAAIGRTTIVTVQRMHQAWALEIRANEFAEPGAEGEVNVETIEKKAHKRPLMRTLFLGAAGTMMGLRVGVKLRGGAWGTLLVGGAMGLLAMLASVMFGGGERNQSPEDSQVSETVDEPEKK
ncbi:MAG: hypothetical protein K8I27_13925 [Planctomycetes bacterium]|nr:hypothetical protein [Planctomycetota bacterium]